MSEFFQEYTHLVAEPTKTWPYFDIPACLTQLPWTVDQCYQHIQRRWFHTNDQFTRHAVVQLALYACDPFREIPAHVQYMTFVSPEGTPSQLPPGFRLEGVLADGYYFRAEPVGPLIDHYPDKGHDQKQRQYLCPTVVPLIEALATALIHYESWSEYQNGWRRFEAQRQITVAGLRNAQALHEALRRRDIPPEEPTSKHGRRVQKDIERAIDILNAITREDYRHAGGQTYTPSDPRVHASKYSLLTAMEKAFAAYGPEKWTREATYRALAVIMNQLQIWNSEGKAWRPQAIKQFLARGPDPRLTPRLTSTVPTVEHWYTRPE